MDYKQCDNCVRYQLYASPTEYPCAKCTNCTDDSGDDIRREPTELVTTTINASRIAGIRESIKVLETYLQGFDGYHHEAELRFGFLLLDDLKKLAASK